MHLVCGVHTKTGHAIKPSVAAEHTTHNVYRVTVPRLQCVYIIYHNSHRLCSHCVIGPPRSTQGESMHTLRHHTRSPSSTRTHTHRHSVAHNITHNYQTLCSAKTTLTKPRGCCYHNTDMLGHCQPPTTTAAAFATSAIRKLLLVVLLKCTTEHALHNGTPCCCASTTAAAAAASFSRSFCSTAAH